MKIPEEIVQGWGMTHYQDKQGQPVLLVYDGSNKLFHLNPKDFNIMKSVQVKSAGQKLDKLNELEYMGNDQIWANIWNSNVIAKIRCSDVKLLDLLNFEDIVNDLESEKEYNFYADQFTGNVLNGIAYDKLNKNVFLGGKRWPDWYEIELK